MNRRACLECGAANLESELRCWACGGGRFGEPGDVPAGERTLALTPLSERTLSWPEAGPESPRLATILLAATVACSAGAMGYWIGRASSPASRPHIGVAAPAGPVALPVPPGIPQARTAPGPAPAIPVYPTVTVRSRPVPGSGAPAHPGAPPPTMVYGGRAPAPPRVLRPVPVETLVPVNPDGGGPPAGPPNPSRAVISVRNDDSSPIEVVVDGNGSRTLMVAPGGVIPLSLGAGTYQLRATGRGANSGRSTLALAANRTYEVVIVRKQEDGKEILALVEPAIDGQPG